MARKKEPRKTPSSQETEPEKKLAIKVFEAALTEGAHLDFLTRKYEKLKRGPWSPDPRK